MRHFITQLFTKKAIDSINENINELSKKVKKIGVLKIDASSIRNIFLLLGCASLIIFLALYFIYGGIAEDVTGNVLAFASMVGLPLFAAFISNLYYIKFEQDEIIHRSIFGIVKHIKYKDISDVLKNEVNGIEVFVGDKKVLSIDEMFMSFPIEKKFKSQAILIKEKNTIDNFTIKIIPLVKYIFLVFFVIALFFPITGIYAELQELNITSYKDIINLVGSILFYSLVPAVFLVFYLYYDKEKYIITDKQIIYRSLLKKDVILNLNDIKYYKEERPSDGPAKFNLYTKNGKSISIPNHPTGYTNIYLLRKLIKEYNWEKKTNKKRT